MTYDPPPDGKGRSDDEETIPGRRLWRRDILKGVAAAGAGALLASCGSDAPSDGIRGPGSRPFPHMREGTDTLPEIAHVIILMMENHSFDNYFGMLDPSVGFAVDDGGAPMAVNPDETGELVRAFRMPKGCQLDDGPSQSWNASHTAFDEGGNGGFVRASGPVAMGYWTDDDLPFYYGLARTFPLASRWFASTLCQTYPNRRFLMAGTAAGIVNTTAESLTAPAPPNGNIFERLDEHGISWRNYYSDAPSLAILFEYAIAHADNTSPIADFFTDAANGTLPSVSLVDPAFVSPGSEENPGDVRVGEKFAADVIRAAMAGPGWDKTLIVWCYDEHGGYYDHVPPPAAIPPDDIAPILREDETPGAYDRYGFRVPAVVISPYAKPDYVSEVVRDHTSILKFIERKWNLGALTYRDANADDLFDCLDFDNPPAFLAPPTLPAPALERPDPPMCEPGDAGVIPPSTLRARGIAVQEERVPVGEPLMALWGDRARWRT